MIKILIREINRINKFTTLASENKIKYYLHIKIKHTGSFSFFFLFDQYTQVLFASAYTQSIYQYIQYKHANYKVISFK